MADVHDKATRSYNMSRIRGKDTKPEMLVRRFLHANGFRYKLHKKNLPGKPDLTLRMYKTVIFVNGCFWHGHLGCKDFVLPKSRRDFWKEKIEGNRKRDKENIELLKKKGWNVIVIFECELKTKMQDHTFQNLIVKLKEQTD